MMRSLLLTVGNIAFLLGAAVSFVGLAYYQWFSFSAADIRAAIWLFGIGLVILIVGIVARAFTGQAQSAGNENQKSK